VGGQEKSSRRKRLLGSRLTQLNAVVDDQPQNKKRWNRGTEAAAEKTHSTHFSL
jgi:hypothetical protein